MLINMLSLLSKDQLNKYSKSEFKKKKKKKLFRLLAKKLMRNYCLK